MSYLPSLPPDATLLDVFRAYPAPAGPLLDYHEVRLRGGGHRLRHRQPRRRHAQRASAGESAWPRGSPAAYE